MDKEISQTVSMYFVNRDNEKIHKNSRHQVKFRLESKQYKINALEQYIMEVSAVQWYTKT